MTVPPKCFVTTVSLDVAEKLQNDLLEQGFALSTPPYTVFSAQKKGVSCTLYSSGKLSVQGKDKDAFISFYLEPEVLGKLSYTYPLADMDFTPRIGIDEAGKGDFFGPLCIAGVQAGDDAIKELAALQVKDSKKMSDERVLSLSKKIRSTFPCSIVRIFPKKYNELYGTFHNLNHLLAWGHATAIEELVEKTKCNKAIIDQFAGESLVINALKRKSLSLHLTQRHGGEADLVVAAASILARAAFLEGLEQLSEQIGASLPKGASQKVVETGRKLVDKFGKEILGTVAKLHFKTAADILCM